MGTWENDKVLFTRLKHLILSFNNEEILCYMKKEFPKYSWSITTLKRRLRDFGIRRHQNVSHETFLEIIKKELSGPGNLLGYRSLYRKIRQEHKLLIKRQDVYDALQLLNPEGLKQRSLTNRRKLFHKREFDCPGPNFIWSIDGHDKLMGRYKSEFPLAIHGCVDAYSRKIIWLKIWPSNCNPELPSHSFFESILDTEVCPRFTRSDRGNENSTIATMQNFLKAEILTENGHIYGSSTTNQVIEKFWREFKTNHGDYYKSILMRLVRGGYYFGENMNCKVILAYLFIPLIQNQMDIWKELYNNHQIRKQNIKRPCGKPNIMYLFPERYGGKNCGFKPTIDRMEYIKNKIKYQKLSYLDEETELILRNELVNNMIEDINIQNVENAYKCLFSKFGYSNNKFSFQ